MKASTQVCQSCGSNLEGAVTSFGVLCRVCALRASCTPGTTSGGAQTTWAEVFPQLGVELTLRERDGESIYLARVLDGERDRQAVLQVVTGESLAAAGGVVGLGARVRDILEADLEGLTPILDSGDLADAFFESLAFFAGSGQFVAEVTQCLIEEIRRGTRPVGQAVREKSGE